MAVFLLGIAAYPSLCGTQERVLKVVIFQEETCCPGQRRSIIKSGECMSKDRHKEQGATEASCSNQAGDTLDSLGRAYEAGQVGGLAPGSQAGRYMILDQIGRGGMGLIYQAYDPELDRRIALKVLRVKKSNPDKAARARERLLREAKALAQLSHPNVVSAFDVGTLGQDVFVAMELVEGQNLKEWTRARQPSIRQRVQAMVAAGNGVVAAHKAGLIHRDLKPENILIGDDGRVKVLDFGLVTTTQMDDSEAGSDFEFDNDEALLKKSPADKRDRHSSSGKHFLSTPMTEAGVVVGTPGYMAPEQYQKKTVDEKTDQYGFCVTLYEALYGQPPFMAETRAKIRAKVMAGVPDSVPASVKIPKRYRRILARGMSTVKADRYPTMESLLQELSWDPRTWRRRILAVAALIVLVASTFFAAKAWEAKKHTLCTRAGEKIQGVWDAEVAAKLRQAFLGTHRPYAQDTFERVRHALDRRAQQWVVMRTEACQATRVKGEQSEQLLDRRMQCLDRRLSEMSALLALLLSKADGPLVDKAVGAVAGLALLSRCGDTEALLAAIAPPADPKVWAQVNAQRIRLDEARAMEKAGIYQAGLTLAADIAAVTEKIPYAPLQAEVLFAHASLLSKSGQNSRAAEILKQALGTAADAKDDFLLARITTMLVFVIGNDLRQFDQALAYGVSAQAAVRRAGNDPMLRVGILNSLGVVYNRKGQYPQAQRYLEQMLELLKSIYSSQHPEMARAYNNLGIALWRNGKLSESIQAYEFALEVWRESLGPSHPLVASGLANLARVLKLQGKYQEAFQYYHQAQQIREKVYAEDHPQIAFGCENLGGVLNELGRNQEALAYLERALTIRKRAHGEDSIETTNTLNSLGSTLSAMGRLDEARGHLEKAILIEERVLGPGHPDLGYPLVNLGSVLLNQHQFDQAHRLFERALVLWEKKHGAEHLLVSYPLTGLGLSLIEQKKPAQALVFLQKALRLRQAEACGADDLAETRFALARALWHTGQTSRALELARQARVYWAEAGRPQQKNLAEANAWLRQRGALSDDR